tara:strand:- start:46665 stop:47612 length:948 start_codon:yes stop_codon:yes gene_type:complete
MSFKIFSIKRTKVLKNLLAFAMLVLIPAISFSQLRSQYWKKFKNEVYFGAGATTYLGDLGGGVESGNHGLSDINIKATKWAVSTGLRSKLTEIVTFRMDLTYGTASGADSLTENVGRKSRNLSFKTTFFTFSPLIEVYVLPERFGRGASPISAYVASGIRLMYFNPQAELDGTWYDLQPLGTEGQLSNAGATTYSKFTVVLPFVTGFKFALPSSKGGKEGAWTIGAELTANWMMTDYFDDASGTYSNPEAIRAVSGNVGASLSDRRLSGSNGSGAGVRGNPTANDWYGTFQVIVGKQLYSRSGRRRRSPSRSSYF